MNEWVSGVYACVVIRSISSRTVASTIAPPPPPFFQLGWRVGLRGYGSELREEERRRSDGVEVC